MFHHGTLVGAGCWPPRNQAGDRPPGEGVLFPRRAGPVPGGRHATAAGHRTAQDRAAWMLRAAGPWPPPPQQAGTRRHRWCPVNETTRPGVPPPEPGPTAEEGPTHDTVHETQHRATRRNHAGRHHRRHPRRARRQNQRPGVANHTPGHPPVDPPPAHGARQRGPATEHPPARTTCADAGRVTASTERTPDVDLVCRFVP